MDRQGSSPIRRAHTPCGRHLAIGAACNERHSATQWLLPASGRRRSDTMREEATQGSLWPGFNQPHSDSISSGTLDLSRCQL